ncbi:MAG: hypothetical protein WD097_09530 [Balneolales bacterium]
MSDEASASGYTETESKGTHTETALKAQGTENHRENNEQPTEVDLVEVAKKILTGWKSVLMIMAVFTCLGLFHYNFGETEYRSEAILIQESEGGQPSAGNELLRQLGGNFGFGGAGSSVLATARGYAPPPVYLYPSIVNSSEFQSELIYRDIEFSQMGSTMTLYEYFTEHNEPPVRQQVYRVVGDYTVRLPITLYRGLRNLFRGSGNNENDQGLELDEEAVEEMDDRLLSATREELSVIDNVRTRITITFETGLTKVTSTLPDPKAAAMMNAFLIQRIQEYMTTYRIEKARQNLEFVQDQHDLARERYEEAQNELARFQDQNLNLTSARAQTELAHLQDQRNLRFNVYNSLSEQVEQARLTLQQQTPVFNILEKPNIPTSPYTGASNLILVFSIVLGFFVGIGWVLTRETFHNYKKRLQAEIDSAFASST